MIDRKTPKFTKRDFQWIADQCKDHFEYLEYEFSSEGVVKYTTFEQETMFFMHWKFVQGLSKHLYATNGNFDRDRFLRAAVPQEYRERWYLGVVSEPVREATNG